MDAISPNYYQNCPSLRCEVIEITAGMTFRRGSAFKYVARAGLKTTDPTGDLRKAEWYLRDLHKSCGGFTYISDPHLAIYEDTIRGALLQNIYMGHILGPLQILESIFQGACALDSRVQH